MVSCTNSPSRKNEYMPEGSLAASFALPVFCVADEDGCCRATAKLKSDTMSAVEIRNLLTMRTPVVTIIACCCWITKGILEYALTQPEAAISAIIPVLPAGGDDGRRYYGPAPARSFRVRSSGAAVRTGAVGPGFPAQSRRLAAAPRACSGGNHGAASSPPA